MRTVEVDFEVFKAITLRRATEDVTENDVLRELLGLPAARNVPTGRASASASGIGAQPDDWVVKGVRFPARTEFRASYKGQTYLGRVEHGALMLNGQAFDTPSSAAMSITNNPVNGWTFWECRLPGHASWQILKGLRRK